jgi:hypothetical protein
MGCAGWARPPRSSRRRREPGPGVRGDARGHCREHGDRVRAAAARARRRNPLPAVRAAALATLSHELRTPLNALLGWIHVMRSGQLSPEKRERALAAISRSAQLQAQLTSDLLDISSVITGKLRLRLEPTRLRPIVEDTVEALRRRPSRRESGAASTCSPTTRSCSTPARIQQILTNLVANAIKFTPAGGAIDISARREGDDLVLQVRDTASGLPPRSSRMCSSDSARPTRSSGGRSAASGSACRSSSSWPSVTVGRSSPRAPASVKALPSRCACRPGRRSRCRWPPGCQVSKPAPARTESGAPASTSRPSSSRRTRSAISASSRASCVT